MSQLQTWLGAVASIGASGSWGGAADRVARRPRRSLRGYGTWCARSTDRYLRPAVWQRLRPEPYRGNARHAARPGPVVARPMSGRAGDWAGEPVAQSARPADEGGDTAMPSAR